ncbi:MAG: hypothetical protein KKB34_04285 [Bacteroidetes bacterium]|nr:hypothetical protein [Bacteroidota bacterium]
MESELENILITSYKDQMILFLKSNPQYFDEAIKLAISDNQPFAWRSAWLLWSCMEENDKRIKKHIKSIVKSITTKKDGHQRELLKILYNLEIEEKYEGILFGTCLNIWEEINKSPSVRFTALKFILKIIKNHPELLEEIVFLMQDHYLESLSPGIKRSIERMMKDATH